MAQGVCAPYLGEAIGEARVMLLAQALCALYLGEVSLCGTVTSSSHMTAQPLGLETRTIARY